jgi:hypothetical protein
MLTIKVAINRNTERETVAVAPCSLQLQTQFKVYMLQNAELETRNAKLETVAAAAVAFLNTLHFNCLNFKYLYYCSGKLLYS